MRPLWLMLVPLMSVTAIADITVVYQDSGSQWTELYIQMPQEQMSAKRVRDLISDKLHSLQSYGIVKLVLASDRQDILHMRKGKAMADYSYDLWAEVLLERTAKLRPIAVALKINGDVGLRFRDEAGISSESVLCGGNPFLIASGIGNGKILHINFSRIPRNGSSAEYVSFFLEVPSPVSTAAAKAYALELKRSVKTDAHVLSIVRSDSWFIANESFPVFYPFMGSTKAPTLSSYLCSRTVVCAEIGGEVDCRVQEYRFGRK